MNSSVFMGLINNAALLLTLGLLYDFLGHLPRKSPPALQKTGTGILLGLIGTAIMMTPLPFGNGVVFDTRSVLLCISGFFFGAIPTLIAVLMTAAVRLYNGGTGAWTGVAVIVTSGFIGIVWRRLRSRIPHMSTHPGIKELYLLGVAVHVTMLAWMLTLPWNIAATVLSGISLPVMVIYPFATAILGQMMVHIEERETQARALKESEEKFRNIFQHHSAIKLLIDPETGDIVEANTAAEKFYGWSVKELKQKQIQDINTLPPDQIQAEMKKARSLERTHFEFSHRLADGSTRYVEVYSSQVQIDGKIFLHSIIHDITDRKTAEKALQASESRYRTTLDSIGDAVISTDIDGKIVHMNPVAETLTGWPVSDAINMPLKQIFHIINEKTRHEVQSPVELVLEKGGVVGLANHTLLVARNGKEIPIADSGAPIKNSKGQINGVVLVFRDQTRERELQERFRTIVENAPDPIFIQTDMRFTYVNPKAVALFGADSLEQLIGKPVIDRFHPDFHETIKKRIHRLNADRKPVEEPFEQPFLRMDGSPVWVETTGQPIVHGGKPGALVFVRDITLRKQAEKDREQLQTQLIQAQKMESVGRLAGGVAHDFNNMLNVIIGNVELAMDKVSPEGPIQEELKQIQEAADRSVDITRQLLAFARRQTISPQALDLNEAIENMLKMLQRLIGENIHLAWHPSKDVRPVWMDPSQVDQILANLCINARDAIADVGKITIETDTRIFDEAYCAQNAGFIPGRFSMLAVSDNGCGMDKNILSHLFEPFFTTKRPGQGTGLGLATVYGIVKQNNGFIKVYSEPGSGTTFRIYLSAHSQAAEPVALKNTVHTPVGKGETVLVVEDEKAISNLIAKILEQLGYCALEAGTPARAMELADTNPDAVHLLITDVVMPEMNGRDLADHLKARHPGIKVLFMSGYTANVIVHHGVLEKGIYFIQKPFSRQELAVKVREVLES